MMHPAVTVLMQEHRSITAVISTLEFLARDIAGRLRRGVTTKIRSDFFSRG